MRKILLILFVSLSSLCHGEDITQLRLDCSDDKKMQDSIINILSKADDATQQKFAAAIATIGIAGLENPDINTPEKVRELLHGKTVDEVIAASRRLAPNIKSNVNIIDGSSKESFSKTLGQLMLSLDADKQARFSESVAKIMYESGQKGETHDQLAKRLDGKNADEIIAMTSNQSAPMSEKMEEIKTYELSKVSEAEAKKMMNEKSASEKKDEPSYAPSLAPSDNY